ncbi:MAG: EscU/YscU/HrcU family type III secretion system export apparatus switch protein [Planctomycetaceae bacterium]
MSDDDDRTLPATPRRRTEAWKSGGTPRSSPLTTAAVLLAVLLYASVSGSAVIVRCGHWLQSQWLDSTTGPVQPGELVASVQSALRVGAGLLTGIVITGLAAALAAELLQAGGKIAPELILPQPDRLIGGGVQRLCRGVWSADPWGEAVRWLSALGLLLALLVDQWPRLVELIASGPVEMASLAGELSIRLLGRLSVALVLLALLNYGWQRWKWECSLRMTPTEQREEQRNDRRRIR